VSAFKEDDALTLSNLGHRAPVILSLKDSIFLFAKSHAMINRPPRDVEIRNQHFSLKCVKALLFDLDDTLYFIPSGAQFIRYGEHLAAFLPSGEKEAYLKQLREAWNEDSPFKVGRAFDPTTGWFLEFDDHWSLKDAHTLEGKKVSKHELAKSYAAGTHEQDLEGLVHLASGWGIPTALGRLRGLVRDHYRKAYVATRTEMMKHPEIYPLLAPPEMKTFFKALSERGYILICATNSDTDDASDVLERLGIRTFFQKLYGEAKKPSHSIPMLKEIILDHNLAYENLLVIGDSVYNDLRDAKRLGSQTVLIERYGGQPLGFVDVRVWDFEGFIEMWGKLQP